ncbi:MAG: hypothetical protein PWR10_1119 [Halanaerobiales bacterium]|nr:hypothetical protein [Halanaerobiales bacterium]
MDTDLPLVVKLGIIGVVLGVVILLISLIKERLEEIKK